MKVTRKSNLNLSLVEIDPAGNSDLDQLQLTLRFSMTIKRQYFIAKEWRTKTHVLTWVWHRWYRTEYEHDIYGIDDGQNLFLLKVRIWYWNVPHDKHKAMESNRLYSGHLDFYRPDDEGSGRIDFIPSEQCCNFETFKNIPGTWSDGLNLKYCWRTALSPSHAAVFYCFKNTSLPA